MSGDDSQPITKTTTTNNFGPSKRGMSVESFKVMDVLRRANELESKFRTGEDDGDGDGGGGIGGGGGRGGGGGGVCHCEVGQPGSGAPRSVVRAAIEALSGNGNGNENGDVDGRLGYTDAFGLISLRTRISNHYAKKYPCPPRRRPSAAATADDLNDEDDGNGNNEIDIDRIVVTTGSSGGFLLAFTACFDVGDTIAIASSGYPCYRNILSALGCALASVKVNDEFKLTSRELRMEIERRKEMGEERLRGLILSSPSNPTGAMLSPDELREICELCDEEGIRFLSDEIYHGAYCVPPPASFMMIIELNAVPHLTSLNPRDT
jgi:aspartate/methionine/tyrosine aminotransferase